MNFIITFHYMDGETFEVEVHPDDMEALMAAIGKSEVYFNNSRGAGIWIPIDKIRLFQVEKVDENGNRVKVSEEVVNEREH